MFDQLIIASNRLLVVALALPALAWALYAMVAFAGLAAVVWPWKGKG